VRSDRRTGLRAVGVGLALAAVMLLFEACGGSSGPGVASLGSSTTTTTSPAAGSSSTNKETAYLDGVKYSECMRSHGVPNFPDPNSDGNFLDNRGILNGVRVDQNSSFYVKANKACQYLQPAPTPAQLQQFLAQALKYAQCLRAHGIPNMPDPEEAGGGITQRFPRGLSPNSPQIPKAMKACRSLSPGGP
jgi:hypothetical protein